MKCSHAIPLLSAFLDEELSVEEMRRVAAHVEGCRSCAAELRNLQLARNLMKGLGRPQPRPRFWQEAYEGLEREGARPLPWWQRLTRAQWSAAILAPALVAATLALNLSLPQPPKAPAPPSAPDAMEELMEAHLEARTAQPLTDQGHVHLLLVGTESDD